MKIPTEEECLKILSDNNTPSNVIEHSKAVLKAALKLTEKVENKGKKVNKELIIAASLLHDITRVEKDHVNTGYELVKKLGYQEVAETIKKHGLHHCVKEEHKPKTTEEKIVFLADKHVVENKIVDIEKRFEYLRKRYKGDFKNEYEFTKNIEKELLSNN